MLWQGLSHLTHIFQPCEDVNHINLSLVYLNFTYQAVFDSRLEVIQEASHMVMMEAASEVNSLIHAFLLHPSQPVNVLHEADDDGKTNTNNGSVDNLQSPSRSKSRRSLRSAKTPRSRPQRLLSKNVIA